jgi:hypothetical protein
MRCSVCWVIITPSLVEVSVYGLGCKLRYGDNVRARVGVAAWTAGLGADRLLERLDAGDTLVVWRLGRNLTNLIDVVIDPAERGTAKLANRISGVTSAPDNGTCTLISAQP